MKRQIAGYQTISGKARPLTMFAGILAISGVLAAQTGTITGVVKDSGGNVVEGANVMANLQTAVPPGNSVANMAPPFMVKPANGPTDKNGSFEIDGLPAGTYQLCVDKPEAGLLNPCIWSDQPTMATVPAGGSASGVAVTAQIGTTITIRVNDPQALIAANPAKDDILIGTGHGKSPFIPALVAERDGGGKTMSLVVPAGQAVNLSVYSSAFQLGDSGGSAFGASTTTVAVTAGQMAVGTAATGVVGTTPTVTIQVIGAAAKP